MPFEVEWEKDKYTCRFRGSVTLESIQSAVHSLHGDSRSDNVTKCLIDMSQIDGFEAPTKSAVFPASLDIGFGHSLKKSLKYAFVVTDPKAQTFLNQFKTLVEHHSERISAKLFKSSDEADSWLES